MKSIYKQNGFTLMELMIAVGIIGVLAATAIPTYNNYISTTCVSASRINLENLALFEENYNIENLSYLAGTHNAGDNLGNSALMKQLHWDPDDNGEYTYTVALNAVHEGLTYDYVISVTGMQACSNASAKFGATKKGFHEK